MKTGSRTRRERARSDTTSLTNWKLGIARAIVATLLTLVVVALTGLPTDGVAGQVVTLGVFVTGFCLVLGAEYAWNYVLAEGRLALEEADGLREERDRLLAEHQEVEAIRRLQEQQAEAYREQLAQWEKRLRLPEAQFKVFRDIAQEEHQTGRKVPFEAMMARLELSTKVATGDFSKRSA
jgi:hypothetical protein